MCLKWNNTLTNFFFYRNQTEEFDYEKDEDDPESDGEAEIDEKQSEYNNSVNLEDHVIKDEDNISTAEIIESDLIDNMDENLKNSDNEYSEILVNILE